MTFNSFNEYIYFINANTDFTGICIVLDSNGQKEYEHNLVNGKYHGKQVSWQNDGKKTCEYNFVNGFSVGIQFYRERTYEMKPEDNSIWLVVVRETL